MRGRVVRPLLDCSRADVLEYLARLEQAWREDATNADTSRLRARVRAELVPLLRAINPRVDEAAAVARVRLLGDEDALLDGMARAFAGDFARVAGGDVRFDRARMVTLSRPMMRRVVRVALFESFPEASRLEFEHVEAVCDGMSRDGFARDLPGGLRAFDEYGTLVISRGAVETAPLAPSLLAIPGTVDLPCAGRITARMAGPDELTDDPLTALVDADLIVGALTVDSSPSG